MTRKFEDKPAVRERVPLLVGLVGASGSGKTYSALRLATGIQRVVGGEIGVIDTEARRALHYADTFKFRHLEFGAPFGPLDYLAAIEHFYAKGVRTIVADSASHVHEGPGGTLEAHETECLRLIEAWSRPGYKPSRDQVNFSAWQKPKAELRRLINTVIQMPLNFVFCFRAKEKLKLVQGEKPKALGWMPIASDEFVYEMTLNCLLMPGSGGVPSWHPEELGEKAIVKLPAQFRGLFAREQPLSEDIGEALARWAEGGPGANEKATVLADIQAELKNRHPHRDKDSQERKAALLGVAFGAKRWADVEDMPLERLREGLATLRAGGEEREPGSDDDTDLFAAERAAAG